MSGGEEHAAWLSRHRPNTLDAWMKCQIEGCNWQVPLPERLCWQHGGPDGPARLTDQWGADTWHFSVTEETVEG